MEPHYLYEQPPDAPVYGRSDLARYDAEIWHVDHQVNRLLDVLRDRGALDQTIVFVTGDHGEAFGEHGDRWHGPNLYNAAVRPGALLRVPGLGRRDDETAVTFTDIMPTVLNLLRVNAGYSNLQGRNLVPSFFGARLEPDHFVIEKFNVEDGAAYSIAEVRYPDKLIYVEEGRRLELYDVAADPTEQTQRRQRGEPSATLRQLLFGFLESSSRRGVAP
jgi:arylsulfatase A-like enzyme